MKHTVTWSLYNAVPPTKVKGQRNGFTENGTWTWNTNNTDNEFGGTRNTQRKQKMQHRGNTKREDMLRGYSREGGQDIARGTLNILTPIFHSSGSLVRKRRSTLRSTLKRPLERLHDGASIVPGSLLVDLSWRLSDLDVPITLKNLISFEVRLMSNCFFLNYGFMKGYALRWRKIRFAPNDRMPVRAFFRKRPARARESACVRATLRTRRLLPLWYAITSLASSLAENAYANSGHHRSSRRQTIGSTKVQPDVTPLPTQNQTNFKSNDERKAVKRKLFLSYDQAEGLSKTKLEEDPGDMIVGIQLWSAKRVPTIRVPNSRKVDVLAVKPKFQAGKLGSEEFTKDVIASLSDP
ncbi:hypothetical protein ARMGADRAFT_1041022 [Armillaria gallica]|uniref:Uncharacterized protein n=1 Tax=Armillaria gallica TaxID=47427 RepID=A0A2H3CCS9_ARMGA|nr:hypothetical protein ARMGADRAFT_1041022 [Armillaria gallica]